MKKSQFILYDFIDSKTIQKKFIIIETEKNEFVTEISYEFEYDKNFKKELLDNYFLTLN